MSERTIQPQTSGPITLDLHAGIADVALQVEDIDRAEITLAPVEPGNDAVADLIARTTVEGTGDRLTVRVPHTDTGGSGTTVISGAFGGVQVIQRASHVTGDQVLIGARRIVSASGPVTIVNGQVITGTDVTVIDSGAITITVRLPRGSAAEVCTTAGEVTSCGPLRQLRVDTTSGDLVAEGADEIEAVTVSGDVRIEHAGQVEVDTTSGDVRIEASPQLRARTVSGRVIVTGLAGTARLRATSGDLYVCAVGDSRVTATTVSGDIRLTTEHPGIRIAADTRSVSGRVHTPNW